MKEIQQKQRFNPIVVLALIGIVLMFGFESIFIFELYRFAPESLSTALQSKTELEQPGGSAAETPEKTSAGEVPVAAGKSAERPVEPSNVPVVEKTTVPPVEESAPANDSSSDIPVISIDDDVPVG